MENYLNELNEAQREAVINYEGPSLVIAGAGSGKTKVLTYRIAYLLHKGVPAHQILSLTFTNKAAAEMKERIAKITGEKVARSLWMGTFHSVFSKILRREAENLGYSANFTIYDTSDSKSLVKSILTELKLDDKQYKVGQVYGRISKAKNNLILPAAYVGNAQIIEEDKQSKMPAMAEIYRYYVARCKTADAMDFDDLLVNMNILLRDFPDVLQKYQQQFRYILVDEYQDTNYAQYLIVKKLGINHQNVCVVGDDAQSIYSFRGAIIENILNFRNDYKNSTLYKLERNYRSTRLIVDAANSIIACNSKQIPKNVYSEKEEGELIQLYRAKSEHEEGYTICNLIKKSVKEGDSNYSDHAILYRTNAQSRVFEEILNHQHIPYRIFGSLSFYQRKEIKDLLSYFRLIVNHKDDEAFKRIINYPARGIGDTTQEKLEQLATQLEVPIWNIVAEVRYYQAQLGINAGTANKLAAFASLINEFSLRLYVDDAYQLAYEVANKSGIIQDLNPEANFENISRHENVLELLNGIQDFVDSYSAEGETMTMMQYLENVSLMTGDEKEDDESTNKVSLMTVHSSKGLEYNNIYIVGMEEELFPSSMSSGSQKEIEEERRLFYVAVTRAREKVHLSFAEQRYKWGNLQSSSPSRFLKDIDPKYVAKNYKEYNERDEDSGFGGFDTIERNSFASDDRKPAFQPRKLMQVRQAVQRPALEVLDDIANPNDIREGMSVMHARFGIGKVVAIEGAMPEAKAMVDFEGQGQKQLLLKFAKLKIMN